MRYLDIQKAAPFDLVCDKIASDKSISHRCAMFSLLAYGTSRIRNFLMAEDTLNTLKIVQELGAHTDIREGEIFISADGIKEPANVLDCGNSGTSIRLFCGLLASSEGFFVLTGDEYLRRRPMKRVTSPLNSVGALIDGRQNGNLAPLCIRGSRLKAFDYASPISSAQVKSALILAALRADGASTFREPEPSRDHTERMLVGMGARIETGKKIVVHPLKAPLRPLDITVPRDPSSAFFFAVAAAIVPGSRVVLKDVTLNPTRIEAYKVLSKMGARVEFVTKEDIYEPIGDIVVEHGRLEGVLVEERISWLIDELPALAIAMAVARGKSVVRNAKELRVKESDRITSVVSNLARCGIGAKELEDGYEIEGGTLSFAEIDSYGDHRIAMSFAIAGLLCGMRIKDTECIATSFPNFTDIISQITKVHGWKLD